jgi:hypothetical protein
VVALDLIPEKVDLLQMLGSYMDPLILSNINSHL